MGLEDQRKTPPAMETLGFSGDTPDVCTCRFLCSCGRDKQKDSV